MRRLWLRWIGLVVFVAVLGTDASLRGLVLATAWAAAANVMQAVGILVLRLVLRVDIARVLRERAATPEGALLAAANLSLGLIVAAAAS